MQLIAVGLDGFRVILAARGGGWVVHKVQGIGRGAKISLSYSCLELEPL
jgi:hypothetical protein